MRINLGFGTAVTAVANVLNGRNRVKEIMAKIHRGVELTNAEWEVIKARLMSGTLKDEWITFLFGLPILQAVIGGVIQACTGHTVLKDTAFEIMDAIPNYSALLSVVVISAIGVKALKK